MTGAPRLLRSPDGACAARRGLGSERAQASVELLGALPALLLLGLVLLQLLAVGYSATLAGSAAEAGALALAAGDDGHEGARRALPGWSRDQTDVDVAGGRVTVVLRPPSLLAIVSRTLAVESSARVGGG